MIHPTQTLLHVLLDLHVTYLAPVSRLLPATKLPLYNLHDKWESKHLQNLPKIKQPDSVFVLAIINSTLPLGFSITWAGSSRNKLPLRSDTSPHISNGNAIHYSFSSPG